MSTISLFFDTSIVNPASSEPLTLAYELAYHSIVYPRRILCEQAPWLVRTASQSL